MRPVDPERNRLLAALPASDYERLAPALEPVRLHAGQVLISAQEIIAEVFFPRDELVVQIPGTAARMSADDFRVALVARTAGCNSVHRVDQRLARWLLMSSDRVGRERFPLTHEFVSMMLGVRRASVTEAAGALQDAGLIAYRHGVVTIVDRAGLEQASCEDYAVTRRTYDNLYGLSQDLRADGTALRRESAR
jgi:CRP-like cAMP-binding protein